MAKASTLKTRKGKYCLLISGQPGARHVSQKCRLLTKCMAVDFSKSVQFMKKNKYQLPVYNMASEPPESFLSAAIPTTVIIDKTGTVVARHEGGADYADKTFYRYIDGLIDK